MALPPPLSRLERLSAVAVVVGFTITAAVRLARLRSETHQSVDFFGYWIDARVGLQNGLSKIYDEKLVQALSNSEGVTRQVLTPQLPPLVWLATPFALLPFQVAEVAWSVLLALGLVATWVFTAPSRGLRKAAFGAVALTTPAVTLALVFGQASLLVAATLAGGYHLLRRDRPLAAGMVFAGLLFKPHIAFLIPAVLLVISPRAFASLAAVGVVAGAIALTTLGADGVTSYVAILRLTAADPLLSFAPRDLTLGGLLGQPFGTLALLLVLALVARVAWRGRGRPPELALAAAVLGSLLVVPFEHVYDSVLLLVAAGLHLRARPGAAPAAIVGLAYLALLVEVPAPGLIVLVEFAWLAVLAVSRDDPQVDRQRRKELSGEYLQAATEGGVYRIVNSRNGRFLLGSTRNLAGIRNRFEFTRSTQAAEAFEVRLREDARRFGPAAFSFEVLDTIEIKADQPDAEAFEDLATLEALWSDKLGRSLQY